MTGSEKNEEIESLKESRRKSIGVDQEDDWRVNRLIATVDRWKEMSDTIVSNYDADVAKLQKEIESLKENRRLWVSEADRYMKERDKAREENERLKAELKRSHTQNKLCQLGESFKYYHEMTKEEAQKHCQAFLSEFD